MGGGLLAFGGKLGAFDVAATRRSLGRPLIMCTLILAPQRVAGALPRRGGRDVDRPSRKLKSSNAGAVGSSASEPGLEGTGDEGTGPTWPTGVFACGMMRVTLRWARGECFS